MGFVIGVKLFLMTQSAGRPRNPEIDATVLEATLKLLAQHGYSGLRITDIVATSGIAKTTIYRRWPTLAHLTVAAMEKALAPRRLDNLDSLIDTCSVILGTDNRTLMAIALDIHRNSDPQLRTIYREKIIDPVRNQAIKFIQDSGTLRNPTTLADAIIGGLIYRAAILGEAMTNAEVRTFIDELMRES